MQTEQGNQSESSDMASVVQTGSIAPSEHTVETLTPHAQRDTMTKRLRWLIGAVGGTLVLLALFTYLGQADTPGGTPVEPVATSSVNGSGTSDAGSPVNETSYQVIPGFEVFVFARGVDDLKAIASVGGDLIATRANGSLLVFPDADADLVSETAIVLDDSLDRPSGLALYCDIGCTVYVAEAHQLSAYTYDVATRRVFDKKRVVPLPSSTADGDRSLLYVPGDAADYLYISVPASCDACNEGDSGLARIYRWNIDRGGIEEVASGIRTAFGLAFHETSGAVWFSDRGRRNLERSEAPDEINVLHMGTDYGWPLCYGDNTHDLEYDTNRYVQDPCQDAFVRAPHILVPSGSDVHGLVFLPDSWPPDLRGDLIVAHAGGVQPSLVHYNLSRMAPYEARGTRAFLSGWEATRTGPTALALGTQPVPALYLVDGRGGNMYAIRPHGADAVNEDGTAPSEAVCRPTGCNNEICADTDVVTTCVMLPQYECLELTRCTRTTDGGCGWIENEAFTTCMERFR